MTTDKAREAAQIQLIRSSMERWRAMDVAGRLKGRGLGRRELLARVALEAGTNAGRVAAVLARKG